MYTHRNKMVKGMRGGNKFKALIVLTVITLLSIWFINLPTEPSIPIDAASPHIPNLFQNISIIDHTGTKITPELTAKDIQITIAVISNNRLHSLKRLLNSLSNVKNPSNIIINLRFSLEASSSQELVDYVYAYGWSHGYKSVMLRVQHGGLINAVSESWFPASNNDYGLLLEDDIEVSPYAILWIEKILLEILNTREYDKARRIIGISLYQPRVTETNENEFNRRKPFNAQEITDELVSIGGRNVPFLFQTPCSWGAVYFPNTWKTFLAYLKERVTQGNHIRIPNSYTSGWQVSWKKFLFELMYIKGYFLVYPNFDGAQSFSTNHLESGAHIDPNVTSVEMHLKQKVMYTVPLVNDANVLKILDRINIADFPAIDLFGYPFTDRLTLAKTFGTYADSNSTGYSYNYLLIKSKNISLYQIINNEEERKVIQRKRKYIKMEIFFKVCPPLYNAFKSTNITSFTQPCAKDKPYIISPQLLDPTLITLVIVGVSTVNNLFERIEYYVSYPLITTIIVVWCDIKLPLPRHSMIGNSIIYFVCPRMDPYLRNMFKNVIFNDIRIATKAVLVLHEKDEEKILHEDIEMMHSIFSRFPENIVSLVSRGLSSNDVGQKAQYDQIIPKVGLQPMDVVMINSFALLNSTCGKYDVTGKIIFIEKNLQSMT